MSMPKKDFCEELVSGYSAYLKSELKAARGRCKEIPNILKALCHQGFKINRRKGEDIIRREFIGAVQRFLFGFYEDAIHHSCFAVEHALLHLLHNKMTMAEKREIYEKINNPETEKQRKEQITTSIINEAKYRGIATSEEPRLLHFLKDQFQQVRVQTQLSFGLHQIIKECKKRNLIEGKTASLGNKLAFIRNAHLHPQNTISGLRLQYRLIEEGNPTMFKLLSVSSPTISAILALPDYKWCTKDSTRMAVEKSVRRFLDDFLQSLFRLDIRKVLELTLTKQVWFKRRAEESLKIAFKILRDIEFY